MKPEHSGFTLIELMIVVVLIAIIATVAVPGFRSMIESSRLTSTTNSTLGLLNYARSEAVKRGEPVLVQAKNGATQNGLEVVLAGDTDEKLRIGDSLPGQVTLVLAPSSETLPVRFNGKGEKQGNGNTVFRVCPGNGEPGIDIVVNRGGQANRAQVEPACA